MFRYVSLEQRVPQDHPLRAVRKLTDAVLASLRDAFDSLCAGSGRPSIAAGYILRALLLQIFFSIRSQRPDYRRDGDHRQWIRRARCGANDA